jgi:drug/metabolite transporter (DMT)-like permease
VQAKCWNTSTIGHSVNPTKVVALLLIVAGALMLAYGSFSYTKEDTAIKLGPIELSVKEKKTVNFPVWAGVGAIVVGGLLLAFGGKR